jgi:hypothetical protein
MISPASVVPTDDDVICSGSRIVQYHPGNIRFEKIIRDHLNDYIKASKIQRTILISKIVNTMLRVSPNGGFLQKCRVTNEYQPVPEHRAVSRFKLLEPST